MMMGTLHFRDDRVGLDARWSFENRELSVFCHGTQGLKEWLLHLATRTIGFGEKVTLVDWLAGSWALHGARNTHPNSDWDMALSMADKVHLTGWSLGGAHAQAIARQLLAAGYNVDLELWAPKRLGNRRFCRQLKHVTTCYRHRGDLIPWLLALRRGLPVRCQRFGKLTWPWRAHNLIRYKQELE